MHEWIANGKWQMASGTGASRDAVRDAISAQRCARGDAMRRDAIWLMTYGRPILAMYLGRIWGANCFARASVATGDG